MNDAKSLVEYPYSMDIALIPNRDKPDAMQAAMHLQTLLSGPPGTAKGVKRVALLPNATRQQLMEFNAALLVVLGGDGSILAAAQAIAGLHTPVLGVNFGKLGYLAAYSLDEFLQNLDIILAGNAPSSSRLMLRGEIYSWSRSVPAAIQSLDELKKQAPRHTCVALNDVVINAGEPFRMIELEVQVNEQRAASFRSDGLVVATASGSTGYNLSAGGPLISPEVAAMVLTPICPHTLSFRPVVLPAETAILVCPHRLNIGSRVSFDGQVTMRITENECLLIRRAEAPLTLIERPHMSHWQMLATKMHWAQSPRI